MSWAIWASALATSASAIFIAVQALYTQKAVEAQERQSLEAVRARRDNNGPRLGVHAEPLSCELHEERPDHGESPWLARTPMTSLPVIK